MNLLRAHFPLFLILAAAGTAFAQALGFDYVRWDDDQFVLQNTMLQMPFWPAVTTAFTQFFLGDYAPLTLLSFWLEAHVAGGADPAVSHGVNLGLHLLNVALLWFWLGPLLRERRLLTGICLIFALHPVQVESVVWVSERKGLLGAAFTFAALLCWRRSGAAYAGFFVAALLSKATTILTPLLLLFIDRKSGRAKTFRHHLPGLAVAAAFAFVRVAAYGSNRPQFEEALWNAPRLLTLPVQVLNALGFYLRVFLWPDGLTIIYPRFAWSWAVAAHVSLFAAFAAAGFTCWRRTRDHRLVLFALISVIYLAPVLQIIPRINYVNDRYLYLPVIGMAGLAFSMIGASRLRAGTLAALAALLLILSYRQSRIWAGDLPLWSAAVSARPESGLAHLNFGRSLEIKGDFVAAVDEYTRAVELPGSDVAAQALNNLSILHSRRDLPALLDPGSAARYLQMAEQASFDPADRLFVRYNLALLQLQLGQRDLARQTCREILLAAAEINDSRLNYLKQLVTELLRKIDSN